MKLLHLGHSCNIYDPNDWYAICDKTASPNFIVNGLPWPSIHGPKHRVIQPDDKLVLAFDETWCPDCIAIYEGMRGTVFPYREISEPRRVMRRWGFVVKVKDEQLSR